MFIKAIQPLKLKYLATFTAAFLIAVGINADQEIIGFISP